jgi:hypothetical protein
MTVQETRQKIVAYAEEFLGAYTEFVDQYGRDILAQASDAMMTRALFPFYRRTVGVDTGLAALYSDSDFYLYFLDEPGVGVVTLVDASGEQGFDRNWTFNAPGPARTGAVVKRLGIDPTKIIPVSPGFDMVNVPGTNFMASSIEVIRNGAYSHGNNFAGQSLGRAQQLLPEMMGRTVATTRPALPMPARAAESEPVFDNGLLPLIAAYRDLREEDASPDRIRHLGDLIVDLLREFGFEAAVRVRESPMVIFRHDSQPFLLGLSWTAEPLDPAVMTGLLQALKADSGDATVILLSMSGYHSEAAASAAGTAPARTLLWDRVHLEAILCGLVSVSDLVAAGARIAFFNAAPYSTLTRQLAGAGEGTLPRMFTPDLLAPPWPVLDEAYVGTRAQLALVGEDGWDMPSGIAALHAGRLVVVTDGGLVELDPRSGVTSSMLQLPGCANEPLVLPDGSVLVACNSAIVRVRDGEVEALAGGFSGNVRLLAGPRGEPWVLSGTGPMFGDVQGSLALSRLGKRVGDQHRYDVQFTADVHTASWLEERRFFVAAAGHSAVVDLNRTSRVEREDWIVSPHGYRSYMLVLNRHQVVIAAGNATGLGVTLWCTDVVTRASEEIGRLVVNSVRGLCTAPDGTGYLLGDVYGARRGPRDPWPVLVRLPGLRPPAPSPLHALHAPPAATGIVQAEQRPVEGRAAPAQSDALADPYDAVRVAARGDRKDYALDPGPLDNGGQAEVFRARHKPSGQFVAFKRLRTGNPNAVARMQREIEVARALGDNPHIMPVLDHSDRYEWFVMPLAQHTAAADRPALGQPEALRALVNAVCDALRPAHALGWIHRDLKPANLLNRDGVWTVGDWGYTRRPRGQTTNRDRTRVGAMLGTEGFAAPELSADAHQAGPQADIYSIGQIIGWILRGEWPNANTPLLPAGGPWRHVVWKATQLDPAHRPATIDDFLDVVRHELDFDQPDKSDPAAQLLVAANDGVSGAAASLFGLAMRHPGDLELHTEVLGRLTEDAVHVALAADKRQAAEVVRGMNNHLRNSGQLTFADADRVITWLHWIEVWAAEAHDLDLLRVAADAVLAWDGHWDHWTPQRLIKAWMTSLTGDVAAVIAGALRDHQDAAPHFEELANNRRVDERIRRAVRPTRPTERES